MPKCAKCGDFLPPQLMKQIEGVAADVKQCIFCEVEKKEIQIPDEKKPGKKIPYTKEQCKKDYQEYLNKMKTKLKTPEDLKKFMKGEEL